MSAEQDSYPDDTVITIKQWCQRAGISYATAQRLIAAGDGPTITKLSTRRLGVRGRDHRAWLDSRAVRRNENTNHR
jgi:predicted DNA-binding transcriptional regulator AlpA